MPAKHETWMPLYIADYLSDTLHLTTEQHGAYLLLLMAAWKRGGHVPADEAQLAQIARMPLDRWHSHAAATILPFFSHHDGMLWHGRVQAELQAARTNVEQKSRAGAAGAAARWQKDGSRIAGALQPHWQTDAPSPSPTPSKTPPKAPRQRGEAFDAAQIELPGWMPREPWAMWCADRKKRGKAITEAGARLQIKALDTYRAEGHAAQAVIEHSIAGGFQGLYPPKLRPGQAQTPAADPTDWRSTWRGIVAKGVALGLGEWSEELQVAGKCQDFPAYRAKVEAKVREIESGPVDPAGQKKVAAVIDGLFEARKQA